MTSSKMLRTPNLYNHEDTMHYRTPELVRLNDLSQAIQCGTHKVAPPAESVSSLIQPTTNAYEADE
jgi:hypothetical protein